MCAVALAPPRLSQTTHPESADRAAAREIERALLIRYHEFGDLAAREELVERFLPLARDLALRYTYADEPFDDLLQVASLGLIKAIDRFEPGRGTKFTSYAAPTILGELKRHFRDKGWSLHVPRDLQERTLAVSRATEVALQGARTLPEGPRGGRAPRLLGREGARGTGGRGQLRGGLTRRAGRPRRRRIRLARRHARPRRLRLRARRGPRRDRERAGSRFPKWSARCSSCASCKTSRSARSANGSATPRCTSHGYCAAL